jgi:cytoskeletal protein RodZ
MSDMRDSASLFGPGKVFAEGREALEISRQQMADVLNLPVRTILAIEENDPTVLPDAVYVNGYMRSYAKLLGLASQPLIDAWWAQHIENDAQVSIEERNDERAEKTVNVRPFKMGRWAVAGLLLSVAFVYFVSNVNQQAASGEEEFRLAGESDVLQQDPLSQPIREAVPEPAQVVARKTVQEPTQEIESDASPLDRMEAQPSPDDAETPDVAGAEAVESAVTEPVAAKPEPVQT